MTHQQETLGHNRLPTLANEINRAHRKARQAARTSLKYAIAAGQLLLEAKETTGHGKWLEWLSLNVVVSERTAQDYMRLAQHQDKLSPKSAAAADLTIRAAIGELIERKPDPVKHVRFIGSWCGSSGDVFIIDDNDSVDDFDFISHLWTRGFDKEGEWRVSKQPVRADHVRSITAELTPELWDFGSFKAVFYTVPAEDLTALIPHMRGVDFRSGSCTP